MPPAHSETPEPGPHGPVSEGLRQSQDKAQDGSSRQGVRRCRRQPVKRRVLVSERRLCTLFQTKLAERLLAAAVERRPDSSSAHLARKMLPACSQGRQHCFESPFQLPALHKSGGGDGAEPRFPKRRGR